MLTYTGALQDIISPGTGLLHLGNRWYSPPVEPNAGVGNQTGPAHFTQPDSYTQLDNPANGNLYAYAVDNPTNYVDPTGACSLSSIISYATGIVGGGTVVGGIAYASFFTEASVPFALGITGLLGGGIVALGLGLGPMPLS